MHTKQVLQASKLYFGITSEVSEMYKTNLRKVGGSIMLAVPPACLDQLKLQVGSTVDVAVEDARSVVATVHPARSAAAAAHSQVYSIPAPISR